MHFNNFQRDDATTQEEDYILKYAKKASKLEFKKMELADLSLKNDLLNKEKEDLLDEINKLKLINEKLHAENEAITDENVDLYDKILNNSQIEQHHIIQSDNEIIQERDKTIATLGHVIDIFVSKNTDICARNEVLERIHFEMTENINKLTSENNKLSAIIKDCINYIDRD
jgi:hypothetical protein